MNQHDPRPHVRTLRPCLTHKWLPTLYIGTRQGDMLPFALGYGAVLNLQLSASSLKDYKQCSRISVTGIGFAPIDFVAVGLVAVGQLLVILSKTL